MPSPKPHVAQPQPIPFSNQPIQQQPIPQSIDRFPSTSEFNQPLQQNYSMASINYGDDQNNQQFANQEIQNSSKSFNQLSLKNMEKENQQNQEEQVQQLQKVKKGNKQIDQDQILRMFQEQQEKKKIKNDMFLKEKKRSSISGMTGTKQGDKKIVSAQFSSKKQFSQDDQINGRKREAPQDSLAVLNRATSFKEVGKTTTQLNSQYSLISSSPIIRDLLQQYKIQYRSSVFDPDWQKQRYKLREQFFQQLCIGIEEMKQKVQLSSSQQQVLEKVREINQSVTKQSYDFGMFKYCRNLVLETDIELFVHFHQKSKQPLSKDYKGQYKFLITNLKDSQNYELRKKLLTKEFNADIIKVANQIQFFTDTKRNQIKEKQQKLLKQFSVDRQSIMLKPEFQHEKEQQRLAENIKYDSSGMAERKESNTFNEVQTPLNLNSQKQQNQIQMSQEPFSISTLTSYNKYIDESTLSQFEELLSVDQIKKMKLRLEEDLRGECRERLLKKFQSQFNSLM